MPVTLMPTLMCLCVYLVTDAILPEQTSDRPYLIEVVNGPG